MWINNSFMTIGNQTDDESLKVVDLYFRSVKDKSVLHIHFDYDNNYKMTISHDSMEIVGRSRLKVGELVQDMCYFIGLSSLSSEASFPAEMSDFEKTIQNIASLSDNTVTQATSQADDIANLKYMMVMIEDARSV